MKNVKVHLALFACSAIFGLNYIISKVVLETLRPGAWAFCRVFCAALILLILVLPEIRKHRPTLKDWWAMGILGFFGVVVNQVAFFEGLARTTSLHAALLNATIPIFALAFSMAYGQERLKFWRIFGVVVSVTGILVLLEIEKLNVSSQYFLGDLLNLIDAMGFGYYLVLAKKMKLKVSPAVLTMGMFMTSSLVIGAYGFKETMNTSWLSLSPNIYMAMGFVIIFSTVLTYFLNNWALARAESSMVGLYVYLQPVVAGLLSRFIYHEQLTLRVLIASLLVFTGVALGALVTNTNKGEDFYVDSQI